MLKESELHTLTELHNPIWVYDVERFRIHWANEQALAFWEADSDEELFSRDFRENMSDAIYALLKEDLKGYQLGKEQTQWWTLFPKGHRKEVYCHYSGVELNDGRVAMLCQIVVTKDLLETELSIHSSTTIASLWSSDMKLKSANPMFKDIYGEDISHFSELFFSERSANDVWNSVRNMREYETDMFLPTPDGDRWHNLQIRMNTGQNGTSFVLRQYDITDRKQSELHHKKLAIVDSLTQLSNRYGIIKQLEELMDNIPQFSLFFIDLDNFKTINDYYGHSQGDNLLVAVAGRLLHRFPDALGSARLGGDEFLLVHPRVSTEELDEIGHEMIAALSEPFYLDDLGELQIGASVGIARYPDDGSSVDLLLRHADAAMYKAKHRGKNNYVYFSKRISDEISRRNTIRKLLPSGISNDEFSVKYHKINNAIKSELSFVEALPQWESSELGYLGLDEFIPIAESSGMVSLLRHITLEQSINNLKSYTDEHVKLLINVTPVELQSSSFVRSLSELLAIAEFPPERLLLEMRVSSQPVNVNLIIDKLTSLREMGVNIGIGRFGNGYSCLSYLHKLPLTHIRLASGLVDEIQHGSLPAVQAVIAMAKQLKISVLAEGVQSREVAELLISAGCVDMDFDLNRNLVLAG